MYDDEQVVPPEKEPVEVLFVMKVDVLPNRPALLPHVVVLLWTLVFDFIPSRGHIDSDAMVTPQSRNVRGRFRAILCSPI